MHALKTRCRVDEKFNNLIHYTRILFLLLWFILLSFLLFLPFIIFAFKYCACPANNIVTLFFRRTFLLRNAAATLLACAKQDEALFPEQLCLITWLIVWPSWALKYRFYRSNRCTLNTTRQRPETGASPANIAICQSLFVFGV